GLEKLLIREAAGEGEQEGGGEEVEEDDARIVAAVGFNEAAGAVGEVCFGERHRRGLLKTPDVGVSEGVGGIEQARLEGEEPGGDEHDEELRAEEIEHEAGPDGGRRRHAINLNERKHEEEGEIGEERGDNAAGG